MSDMKAGEVIAKEDLMPKRPARESLRLMPMWLLAAR